MNLKTYILSKIEDPIAKDMLRDFIIDRELPYIGSASKGNPVYRHLWNLGVWFERINPEDYELCKIEYGRIKFDNLYLIALEKPPDEWIKSELIRKGYQCLLNARMRLL